ncbi:hypothetical protein RchiOBHm_Chr6g0259741 [Rosa chinensis]|uniref:Expp1 protein n=1 Tax=Rosa chinensis TaxID=74649 RepID=A0A2P6PMZ3_ROSCH|nr:uncharacterized protein LOC112172311 [Rosa chinensis]PRQ23291.1 hypothetical protein RchiOBHm_Chr6g0259741 [Rosa chinensis]
MGSKSTTKKMIIIIMLLLVTMMRFVADAGSDTNGVFDPCSDATIQRWDGFTFGLAFSNKDSFFFNQTQFSPCDTRLSLSSPDKKAQLAVFRPKVDEISFLTIDSSSSNPAKAGGYMVAFAGRKYAARSPPILVADDSNTITSFTLVLEFNRGILQNLYWKKFGCKACSGDYSVCLNGEDCAVPNSKCKSNGGTFDCNLSIQLTFSGTDKNLEVLNSWYEVEKLQKYSLYSLFKNFLI